MANLPLAFQPTRLNKAMFNRSNVFEMWSRKADRHVQIVGPTLFDAWLAIEFDPTFVAFCERPPVNLELLPLEGKRRPLDFWVLESSGRQKGLVVHDSTLSKDHGCSDDLLRRSIAASKLSCEVWLAGDLRKQATYLRNLKQLQPYLAMEMVADDNVAAAMVDYLQRVGTSRLVDLCKQFQSRPEVVLHVELAKLIHAGSVIANIRDVSFSAFTLLEVP